MFFLYEGMLINYTVMSFKHYYSRFNYDQITVAELHFHNSKTNEFKLEKIFNSPIYSIKTTKDNQLIIVSQNGSNVGNGRFEKYYLTANPKLKVEYINSKASLFEYEKITQFEIQECNNMLEFKILLFKRFQNLTNKQYFASISQLFQIAVKNDETEYLAFLRDSQHFKFSSISIKHAALFLKMGVLK